VPAVDIFAADSRWATYRVEYFVSTIVGGIPKDPDTIRGWLKSRMELEDTEILALANETLAEMGITEPTSEQLDELTDTVMAKAVKGNGFKRPPGFGLVIERRNIKGALKEAANVCYPGVKPWPGKPEGIRKGLASYLDERVEVVERYIELGKERPDIEGEQRIKHVSGPQGKRSTINVVDVCEEVKMAFHLRVLDDCFPPEVWAELWEYIEVGGLGADRARGDGRGELLAWQRVDEAKPRGRKRKLD